MSTDHLFMTRALELAQRGQGSAAPNPMVGAVLVHDGRTIGEGWHHEYGQAHAEVDCLNSVSANDKHLIPEATMYVTLEPCAHHGKTPPCANRLVQEGIKKVVIANKDPFASVNGRGIALLQDAGIAVETGLMAAEGTWINRRFFTFHTKQRPYIILKWAQTANGLIAPPDGRPVKISNGASHQFSHKWRIQEAAIMVGANTALNDDPALTARLWAGKNPMRVLLDRQLRVPGTAKLYNADAPTLVVNVIKDTKEGNIQWLKAESEDLLQAALGHLYSLNKTSVIIEGGATLLQSCIAQGLWDEARIFRCPTTLPSGIAAPIITNGTMTMQENILGDVLELWVNCQEYPRGMAL